MLDMWKSFLPICSMLFIAIVLLAISTATISGISMCASILAGDMVSAGASFKVFFCAVFVAGVSYRFAQKCDDENNPPLL